MKHRLVALVNRTRSIRLARSTRGSVVQLAGFACAVEGGFLIGRTAGFFTAAAVLVFVGHTVG